MSSRDNEVPFTSEAEIFPVSLIGNTTVDLVLDSELKILKDLLFSGN